MKTSKSPRKVLQVAYATAKQALSPYAHRYSPKKFTQHQVFACLVLKESLKLDYRGVWELLRDTPDLCRVIELHAVPHWTTLQKAHDRLLKKDLPIDSLSKRSMKPGRSAFSPAAAR